LFNDSDVEGDPLKVVSHGQPSNGAVSVAKNGCFYYTPGSEFNGTVNFDYIVCDEPVATPPETSMCDTGTVTITVNSVNDAPIANDIAVSTIAGLSVDITLTATDPDDSTLTYSVLDGPISGLSGTAPNLSFVGTTDTTFTFQVCDPGGLCDTGEVTIDILEVCSSVTASASPSALKPPNNKMKSVAVSVDDNDFVIIEIRQDEPVGLEPDAEITGPRSTSIRAERDGGGNGRVYTIILQEPGGDCVALALVYVEHDASDNGAKYDSTKPGF
jgi:hypothetical protein